MNQQTLHPSELTDHLSYRLRSGAAMWGATGLSFALALGSLVIPETNGDRLNHWLRTGMIGGALAAAVVGSLARENAIQRSRIGLDAVDISAASRQQRYYEMMKPGADGVGVEAAVEPDPEPWEPDLFDWGKLASEPNRYPHLILLGATGDGKTTLAEWLHQQQHGAKVAVHPHWQRSDDPSDPADFAYCDRIVGGGRNFPAITDYLVSLRDEMSSRAAMSKTQLKQQPPVVVAIDELPAIGKNCTEDATEAIISLLFEARKFRIRLMLLAQADSVKILGLEGQGAVRENLTYVRLGDYAVSHARWLVSKRLAHPDLAAYVEAQDRPCMVEDCPATVPHLGAGSGPVPTGFAPNREPLPVRSEPVANEPMEPLPLNSPSGSEPESTPDPLDPLTDGISPTEWQRVVNLRGSGMAQDKVIEMVWGAKKGNGKSYRAARDKYRSILESAGLE